MEWYESAGRSDYNFDTPAPTSSAAAYGTFEDEPPLLEGDDRKGCVLVSSQGHNIIGLWACTRKVLMVCALNNGRVATSLHTAARLEAGRLA